MLYLVVLAIYASFDFVGTKKTDIPMGCAWHLSGLGANQDASCVKITNLVMQNLAMRWEML